MSSAAPAKGHLRRGLTWRMWLIVAAALAALHALPWIAPNFRGMFIMIFLYALMGQGWNVLGGYAGQFSFGHSLFFGLGAYTSTLLFIHLGLSPWAGMLGAFLVAVSVGLFVGYLSFRYGLKGPYFALIMLAFAEIFHMVAKGWSAVGASLGLLIPLQSNSFKAMQFFDKQPFYFIALYLMLASVWLVWRLEGTRVGLYFQAVRENHDAAEALGVDTFRTQMIAMVISSGMTAIGGTIYAQYTLYIDPDSTFGVMNSVEIMLRPIIGGPGTVLGPLLGSVVLTPLSEVTRLAFQSYSGVYLMLYGIILVVVIMFLPDGLMGIIHKLSARLRRRGR